MKPNTPGGYWPNRRRAGNNTAPGILPRGRVAALRITPSVEWLRSLRCSLVPHPALVRAHQLTVAGLSGYVPSSQCAIR